MLQSIRRTGVGSWAPYADLYAQPCCSVYPITKPDSTSRCFQPACRACTDAGWKHPALVAANPLDALDEMLGGMMFLRRILSFLRRILFESYAVWEDQK